MAKRKKYKLQRTKMYSPLLAAMGGHHHTDHMPINYGTIMDTPRIDEPNMYKADVRTKKKYKGNLYTNNN